VGTCGSTAARLAEVTARARTLPLAICGIAVAATGKPNCVSPLISDGTISTEPLYGTCTTSMPVADANAAPDTCAAEPIPPEA
jgi:hypothetical protein